MWTQYNQFYSQWTCNLLQENSSSLSLNTLLWLVTSHFSHGFRFHQVIGLFTADAGSLWNMRGKWTQGEMFNGQPFIANRRNEDHITLWELVRTLWTSTEAFTFYIYFWQSTSDPNLFRVSAYVTWLLGMVNWNELQYCQPTMLQWGCLLTWNQCLIQVSSFRFFIISFLIVVWICYDQPMIGHQWNTNHVVGIDLLMG